MRAKEFLTDQIIKDSQAVLEDINGNINYCHYIELIDSELSESSLFEQLSSDDVDYIKSLKSYSAIPKIGEYYAPVMAFLLPNDLKFFGDKQPLQLTRIRNDSGVEVYDFIDDSGKVKTYPDTRLTEKSYAELFLFNNAQMYLKFKLAITLKFKDVKLPNIKFDPALFEISDALRQNYLHRAGKHVDRRMERMAAVRDRLNKGYEIYHADSPTKIVDRFEANTPALAKQYYDNYIANYESDVDYDLRLRRSTGIMENLNELVEPLPALINKTADVDGILVSINTNNANASVYASSNGRRLGYAEFDRDDNVLVPYDLAVDDKYRGQGIAAVMYDYVKRLGFKIKASADQTDAGKQFWKKNRGQKRVWESTITQDASPAQAWIDKVYAQYPDWPYGQADKVMVWGEGEEQQFAAFKLRPGPAPDTVEIDWIMAGPEQRKGVGSRAIKELQRQAQAAGIRLTLYPWAKGQISQASLTKLYKRHGFKPVAKGAKPMVWEPVNEIAKIPQGDFGDADTLTAPEYDIEKKELPGGAGFTYAVNKTGTGDLEIMIFDGNKLAAELDLFETQDVTNAWRVSTVAVNPQYRGRGLGKALYGVALSILRLTLEAGDTQTKHGQHMWLMLNSIPGVEVMGYNMEPTDKYQARKGDKIIAQDKTWTRYTFPVKPGTHSMRSGRHGTGMYTSMASMIAKWTGQ